MGKSVSIIIPAYNEEKKLAPTVQSVLEKLNKNAISDFEILIFDDASVDKTGEIADELAKKNFQIRVIHNPKNMNLGFNFVRGVQLATKEFVGMVPGDNESTDSLDYILPALGSANILISYIINPEARPWPRRFLSSAYVKIINLAFGLNMRYYNGMCYFRSSLIKQVPVSTFGFAYMTEILVKLLKLKTIDFVEIPLVNQTRERGASKAFRLKNIASVFKTFLMLFWEVQILRKRISLK